MQSKDEQGLQDQSGPIDIGPLIDHSPWSALQIRVWVLATLAILVDGIANHTLGLAMPALAADWNLSKNMLAPVQAFGLGGLAIGTVIGGLSGDRFGRRISLIGAVLLFACATMLTATVHNLIALTFFRALGGLGLGGAIPNAIALIAEYMPAKKRPLAIAMGMVFIPIGSMVAGLIASHVLPHYGWRMLYGIDGVLPLLAVVLFFFMLPESPRYLVRFQARQPAMRTQLLKILRQMGHHHVDQRAIIDTAQKTTKAPLNALLGQQFRFDTLALWGSFFFTLMATYTLQSWIPSMLADRGFDLKTSSTGIVVFGFGGMLGSVVSGWLMVRYGSRLAVLSLCLAAAAGALVLAVTPFSPAGGVLLILFVLAVQGLFLSGIQSGLYPVAANIYPPYVKATGVGTASAIGRVGAMLSSFSGAMALDLGGASAYFIVIAATISAAFITIFLIHHHVAPGQPRPSAH